MGSLDNMPYWHHNVPEHERTSECPEFLLDLSDKDRRIVGTPDSSYHILSWPEVCETIDANRLERFQRVPSQLRRYKAFTHRLARQYGSVADFILQQRLRWKEPIVPDGPPFQCEDDWKIILNDWPYGIDKRIVHLVIWTKFELTSDPETADLTEPAREKIEAFVSATFRSRMPPGHVSLLPSMLIYAACADWSQVRWFKNWSSLKSVHAVEHFHVVVFDPDPDFVRETTHGDVPQCDTFELSSSNVGVKF